MTRVFLAAGVAALAIAAPASAGPHGGHGGGGGKDRQAAAVNHGGGGGGGGPRAQRQAVQRGGGGGGGGHAMRQSRPQHAQRMAAFQRPQHQSHQQARPQHSNRAQTRVAARQQVQHGHAQNHAQARMADRQQVRSNRGHGQNHAQARMTQRQQIRANHGQAQNRMAERQQLRANRADNRMVQNERAMRDQMRNNRQMAAQDRMANRQQLRAERQMSHNLLADRRALRADRIANADVFRSSRIARSLALAPETRFIAPAQAVRFVDQPLSTVTNYVPLMALPASVSYLYPNTPNYYYQYGGGYLYQVDRGSSLINALIPLLAGGFLPGTYLPQTYMSSYVPSYYGLNSFYPSSYSYGYGAGYGAGYGGYGYQNLCNRYAYGVVYQVDCYSGMVENVIPTYAGGYGVGQMLPSAYSYYNLPMQYRSMYYPTADYSYWYAPGAIYQYDRGSSLITSVAALMSPGFTVGQPLPTGYGMYNVPMAYRATYYDTPNAWYRYNNGYIYQVDPSTMLVSSIVASLLT